MCKQIRGERDVCYIREEKWAQEDKEQFGTELSFM